MQKAVSKTDWAGKLKTTKNRNKSFVKAYSLGKKSTVLYSKSKEGLRRKLEAFGNIQG